MKDLEYRAFKTPLHGWMHYLACTAEQYIDLPADYPMDDETLDGAMDRENFDCFMREQIETMHENAGHDLDEFAVDADIESEIEEIRQIARFMMPGCLA